MPFDLARAATRLRLQHADPLAFRHALLDYLFATGCAVGEQAVALEGGDAICVRASGPSAPSLAQPIVVVVVDLDPPHLGHVAQQTGRPAHWPAELASLGGPPVAISWLSIVHALASSTSQRPWQAIYLRGPALGLGAYVQSILDGVDKEAEIVQAVPSISHELEPRPGPWDLARVDLVRARNVWRFPACDHSYVVAVDRPWREAFGAMRAMLADLENEGAWTLHDVHLYHADAARLAAVLRTSSPVEVSRPGFMVREVAAGHRLMFPVNDVLAGLQGLAGALPDGWSEELGRPLHLHVLPDGLRAYFRVPAGASRADLPDRAGTLSAIWQVEPLAVVPSLAVLPLAVGDTERLGPVPPGAVLQGAVVWQLPTLADNDDLTGLARAIASAVD